MNRLIVLSDYGLDDAIATIDILNHSSLFSQIDILPIGGNVPVDIAMRNIKVLLSNYSGDISKVRLVDTSSVMQNSEYLKEVHGNDGMGDLFVMKNQPNVPILMYNDWVQTISDSDILLGLGPFTVTKDILETLRLKSLVFMGGCISSTPNYNGYEFNHGMDKGAFSYCTKLPHVIVTLDTGSNPYLNITGYEIVGNDIKSLLLRKYQQMCKDHHEIECYVWDDIAVNYLLHPDWFTTSLKIDKDGNKLTCLTYTRNKHILDSDN